MHRQFVVQPSFELGNWLPYVRCCPFARQRLMGSYCSGLAGDVELGGIFTAPLVIAASIQLRCGILVPDQEKDANTMVKKGVQAALPPHSSSLTPRLYERQHFHHWELIDQFFSRSSNINVAPLLLDLRPTRLYCEGIRTIMDKA